MEHGIPEGRVDSKFTNFPVLKSITADKIRVSQGTINHIASILARKLDSMGSVDTTDLNPSYALHFIRELRNAIPMGIILLNHQADDSHNPLDRQLEIYSYVDMSRVDPSLSGIAKMKIYCRLSLNTGTLSLRTIQKNFPIE